MGSGSGQIVNAALLLGNAALAALALLVARYGVFVRPTRRLTAGLSVVGMLVGIAFALGALTELWQTE